MVSLQKLKNEGLIPAIQPGSDTPLSFSGYTANWWDGIAAENITLNGRKIFSAEDFCHIYLQIEFKESENLEWVAVKMSVAETENTTEKPYNKEKVRRARQILQDYFVKKVPNCQRIRFQFQSPKVDAPHAFWLTICRVYYGETNYKERITDTQKAFDALKP